MITHASIDNETTFLTYHTGHWILLAVCGFYVQTGFSCFSQTTITRLDMIVCMGLARQDIKGTVRIVVNDISFLHTQWNSSSCCPSTCTAPKHTCSFCCTTGPIAGTIAVWRVHYLYCVSMHSMRFNSLTVSNWLMLERLIETTL